MRFAFPTRVALLSVPSENSRKFSEMRLTLSLASYSECVLYWSTTVFESPFVPVARTDTYANVWLGIWWPGVVVCRHFDRPAHFVELDDDGYQLRLVFIRCGSSD